MQRRSSFLVLSKEQKLRSALRARELSWRSPSPAPACPSKPWEHTQTPWGMENGENSLKLAASSGPAALQDSKGPRSQPEVKARLRSDSAQTVPALLSSGQQQKNT